MTASKQKGTRAESAVVKFLRSYGWDAAERRTLSGSKDKGDIAGIPNVVIEVKDCAKQTLGAWVQEANTERTNAEARIGVVWHKRRGKGSPGEWYVTMQGWDFLEILEELR